ncbi:TonB-dependent receptor [Rhodovarius crocodyli]|nr:TonB-dependent receptor [Rhodovarius crocodyli]
MTALSAAPALAQTTATTPATATPSQTEPSRTEPGQTIPAIRIDEVNVRAGAALGELRPLGAVPPAPLIPLLPSTSASVIDRADIERSNAPGMLELLESVPGVSINRVGGINGTIFLRGFNTNDFRVPMYIDGDRARGRNTLQLMLLSPEEIERIEVIRGAASFAYGSDSLGGLVNVVTRRPRGNAFQPGFSITGGDSFILYGTNGNRVDGGIGIEAAGSGFDARVSITGRRSDDYRSGAGRVRNSDYETGSLGLNIGYSPSANQRVELGLRVTSVTDGRGSNQPAAPAATLREAVLNLYSGRIAYSGTFDHGLFRSIEASIYRNEFYTKLVTSTRAASQITTSNSYVMGPVMWGGRVSGMIPWGPTRTTLGLDVISEQRPGSDSSSAVNRYNSAGDLLSITPTARRQTGPAVDQVNAGAFVTTEWDATRELTLSAAGRFDYVYSNPSLTGLSSANLLPAFRAAQDTTATAVTGAIGVNYRPIRLIEFIGNINNSFRYPVPSELFSQGLSGSTYTIPNPDLRPERGVNFEGGFRVHFPNATFRATMFHSRFENFLANVSTTYNGYLATQRQNVGQVHMTGFEGDWRWQLNPALNFFGNVTVLRADNVTTHRPVAQIMPFGGRAGLQYVLADQGIALTGTLNWAAGKTRIDTASEYKTTGYAVMNLSAEFRLDRLVSPRLGNTTLSLSANNLFDASYRSAATIANMNYRQSDTNPLLEPGRTFLIGLRNRF